MATAHTKTIFKTCILRFLRAFAETFESLGADEQILQIIQNNADKEMFSYSKIVVPALPSKAIKRQLPFRGDDGEQYTLGSSLSIYLFDDRISHLHLYLY